MRQEVRGPLERETQVVARAERRSPGPGPSSAQHCSHKNTPQTQMRAAQYILIASLPRFDSRKANDVNNILQQVLLHIHAHASLHLQQEQPITALLSRPPYEVSPRCGPSPDSEDSVLLLPNRRRNRSDEPRALMIQSSVHPAGCSRSSFHTLSGVLWLLPLYPFQLEPLIWFTSAAPLV